MSLSDLLQVLASGRKTGLLKCSQSRVVKGIYFENGTIIGSSTTDPREFLGQVLLHYGKIDEPQLQAAMAIQRGGVQSPMAKVQSPTSNVQSPTSNVQSRAGEAQGVRASATNPNTQTQAQPLRLGPILVAQGLITDEEVTKLLKIRTLDIIYDLFLWKDGHFEFSLEDPLPADFTRVDVEANRVVIAGAYRADQLARYRTLIPSDRAVIELGTGWTSALGLGKETRILFYFLEKRMSVAEICYNMHASSFEVYGQLYELVEKGLARVAGELPETPHPIGEMPDLPKTAPDLLLLARGELDNNEAEKAISIIHTLLRHQPQDTAAHSLLLEAEAKFLEHVYSQIPKNGVPKLVVALDDLATTGIGSEEAFVLSRINGDWDIPSILSICPFREADSLLMIKKLWDKGIIGF